MPAPSSRAAARLIARGAGLSLLAAASVPAYLTIAPAWRPLAARLGCAALVAIGCLRARAWARDALGAAPAGGVDAPPAPEVALDARFLRLRGLGAADLARPADRPGPGRRGPSLDAIEAVIARIEERP